VLRGSGVGDTSSVTLGCNFSFSCTICVGVMGADCDGTGVGGAAAIAGTSGAAPEEAVSYVSPA